MGNCGQCGKRMRVCHECHNCNEHCYCNGPKGTFDADELGLDPETDNTPKAKSRHA